MALFRCILPSLLPSFLPSFPHSLTMWGSRLGVWRTIISTDRSNQRLISLSLSENAVRATGGSGNWVEAVPPITRGERVLRCLHFAEGGGAYPIAISWRLGITIRAPRMNTRTRTRTRKHTHTHTHRKNVDEYVRVSVSTALLVQRCEASNLNHHAMPCPGISEVKGQEMCRMRNAC